MLDRGLARLWPPSQHLLESGIEGKCYLGLVPLLLGAVGLASGRRTAWVRFLGLAALVFGNLALGPSLHLGDAEFWAHGPRRHLLLYHWFVKLPFAGGARVPSRFTLLVTLALGLLAGFGLAWIAREAERRLGPGAAIAAASALVLLVVGDLYPGRFHPLPLHVPPAYALIARDPDPVSVLDVPLLWTSGVRGYGDDSLSLYYQTAHGKRIFSGSVSRLPDATFDALLALPLVGAVMHIQLGCDPDPWLDARSLAEAAGFAERTHLRYVVLRQVPEEEASNLARIAAYLDAVTAWEEFYRDDGMCVLRRRE